MKQIILQKKKLRNTIKTSRKNQKNQYKEQFYQNIKSIIVAQKNLTIAAYLSTPTEPPTQYAIKQLFQTGHTIILPICKANKTLHWAKYTPNTNFVPSKYAPVMEPETRKETKTTLEQAQIILVPALAIDYQGNRLGQGGGFYDTALSQLKNNQNKIFGLIFSTEFFPQKTIPHDTQDSKVQGIITEKTYFCVEDKFN